MADSWFAVVRAAGVVLAAACCLGGPAHAAAGPGAASQQAAAAAEARAAAAEAELAKYKAERDAAERARQAESRAAAAEAELARLKNADAGAQASADGWGIFSQMAGSSFSGPAGGVTWKISYAWNPDRTAILETQSYVANGKVISSNTATYTRGTEPGTVVASFKAMGQKSWTYTLNGREASGETKVPLGGRWRGVFRLTEAGVLEIVQSKFKDGAWTPVQAFMLRPDGGTGASVGTSTATAVDGDPASVLTWGRGRLTAPKVVTFNAGPEPQVRITALSCPGAQTRVRLTRSTSEDAPSLAEASGENPSFTTSLTRAGKYVVQVSARNGAALAMPFGVVVTRGDADALTAKRDAAPKCPAAEALTPQQMVVRWGGFAVLGGKSWLTRIESDIVVEKLTWVRHGQVLVLDMSGADTPDKVFARIIYFYDPEAGVLKTESTADDGSFMTMAPMTAEELRDYWPYTGENLAALRSAIRSEKGPGLLDALAQGLAIVAQNPGILTDKSGQAYLDAMAANVPEAAGMVNAVRDEAARSSAMERSAQASIARGVAEGEAARARQQAGQQQRPAQMQVAQAPQPASTPTGPGPSSPDADEAQIAELQAKVRALAGQLGVSQAQVDAEVRRLEAMEPHPPTPPRLSTATLTAPPNPPPPGPAPTRSDSEAAHVDMRGNCDPGACAPKPPAPVPGPKHVTGPAGAPGARAAPPTGQFSTEGLPSSPARIASPGAGVLHGGPQMIGACHATSVVVNYKLGMMMGEPMVTAQLDWSGPGDCSYPLGTKVWLKLASGSAFGWIEGSPLDGARPGSGLHGGAVSPSWGGLVCSHANNVRAGCMSEQQAKTLWSMGQVVGFAISWPAH